MQRNWPDNYFFSSFSLSINAHIISWTETLVHGLGVGIPGPLNLFQVLEDDVVQGCIVIPQLTHHQTQAQEFLFIQFFQCLAEISLSSAGAKKKMGSKIRQNIRAA